MSEPHPLLMMMFATTSFVGPAEMVDDEIMPLEDQLNLSPGTKVIVAAANTSLERDFTCGVVLDAETFASTYPDWEERILRSYVLCRYFSRSDPEINVGWFSRVKLLPIADEHFDEAESWAQQREWPSEIPTWAHAYFQDYTDRLSERAPSRVPKLVTCPNCGSRDVMLVVVHRTEYKTTAGMVTINDQPKIVPVTEVEDRHSGYGRLVCQGCSAIATMDDDEWFLPGITN